MYHFGPKGGAVCQWKVYELKVVPFLLRMVYKRVGG